MSLSTITQIRLPNGNVANIVDWTDRPLYSTVDILHGATDETLPLFTYVVSEQVTSSANLTVRRTATERDTNVATGSAMASTEEMLVYSIRVNFEQWRTDATSTTDASTAAADQPGLPIIEPQVLAEMQQRAVLQFIVSQKIYAEHRLGWYNSGYGVLVSGGSSDTALAERYFAAQGLPSAEAVRSYVIPHHIGAQEKYRVNFFNPDGSAYSFRDADGTTTGSARRLVRSVVSLDGLYKRPVA